MRKVKKLVCFAATRVLFYALKVLVSRDSRVREAFSAYRTGYVFRLNAGMETDDARLTFCIAENGGLAKMKDDAPADMEITMKTVHEAFKVFVGVTGIADAYARHWFFVKGNPYETMGLVRGLELAEAYLFPSFLAKRILSRVPHKQCAAMRVYGAMLFLLLGDVLS